VGWNRNYSAPFFFGAFEEAPASDDFDSDLLLEALLELLVSLLLDSDLELLPESLDVDLLSAAADFLYESLR
jgi:hypothetical protein